MLGLNGIEESGAVDVFALISEQTKQAVQEMDRTAAAEKLRGAL